MKSTSKKIIIILLSVSFLTIFLNYNTITEKIANRIVGIKISSAEKIENLLKGKNPELISAEIFFNDKQAAYDKESNTIYIPQNLDKNSWQEKLKAKSGQLYLLDDDFLASKRDAVSSGHIFQLYLIGENTYNVYNLIFTGMPIMNIRLSDKKPQNEEIGAEGALDVIDPYRLEDSIKNIPCTYALRGASAKSYEKSSYKLKLNNHKKSLLGMRKDDDWILNALYDDSGLIHNKLSYAVWREIAKSNNVKNDEGTTQEYIELFIDDEYLGVYGLTERIDAKELSLTDRDFLYKCRSTRIPEEHNYTNEMTDNMSPIFILKYPKEDSHENWEPLKAWVNLFCKDELTSYEEGTVLLNMENAIDYNLFCLLICGTDNMRKNIYFIAECQEDGAFSFKKVPWDLNATWGNPWIEDPECNFSKYNPKLIEEVDAWCTDIDILYYYNEVEVSKILLDRWQELRQTVLTKERLYEILNEQFGYLHLSGAYHRNYERWPHGAEYWKDEFIYQYIDGRLNFLDNYFEQLYFDSLEPDIYMGTDYTEEFNAKYYWQTNKETLEELYSYDKALLLEHYALYGKPFELEAKKPGT